MPLCRYAWANGSIGGHSALRRTHLVVREDQIGATTLNIEADPEPVKGNSGALDVPPRPTGAQQRLPARLGRPGVAPHQAVQRSLLARPIRITATLGEDRNSLFLGQVGERTELRVTRLRKIEILELAVVHRIDGLASLQLINQVHDQRNRLHRSDIVPRWQHIEGRHVLSEQLGLLLGECGPVHAGFRCPLQQRVVNIGDVLNVIHIEAAIAPHPVQQVKGDVGVGVADMRRVVRSDSADVHAAQSRYPGRSAPAVLGGVERLQRVERPMAAGVEAADGSSKPAWRHTIRANSAPRRNGG